MLKLKFSILLLLGKPSNYFGTLPLGYLVALISFMGGHFQSREFNQFRLCFSLVALSGDQSAVLAQAKRRVVLV